MRSRTDPNSFAAKPHVITRAQLELKKTLRTLEAQRAQTEAEIRIVRSALAVMGVQNPRLAARAKRKPMSPAERKSVSKRMKAYWAKKRAKAS
jgi:hypothetical protein